MNTAKEIKQAGAEVLNTLAINFFKEHGKEGWLTDSENQYVGNFYRVIQEFSWAERVGRLDLLQEMITDLHTVSMSVFKDMLKYYKPDGRSTFHGFLQGALKRKAVTVSKNTYKKFQKEKEETSYDNNPVTDPTKIQRVDEDLIQELEEEVSILENMLKDGIEKNGVKKNGEYREREKQIDRRLQDKLKELSRLKGEDDTVIQRPYDNRQNETSPEDEVAVESYIEELLNRLDSTDAEVLNLRLQQFKKKEIGEALDIPSARVTQALKNIAKAFEDVLYEAQGVDYSDIINEVLDSALKPEQNNKSGEALQEQIRKMEELTH